MESSSSAKIILFGEHAVVYGQPALAAPVTSIRARVKWEMAPKGAGMIIHSPLSRQTLFITEIEAQPDANKNSLVYALQLALRHLGLLTVPDLEAHINSDIPLGRGLGSGAAVSAALVRGLCEYFHRPIDNETLNNMIFEVEKLHHGTPSGIDNTVVVYEKTVFFVRGQPLETIRITQPFTLLIGDTGYGTPTHITVGDVRRLYEAKPDKITAIFERIGAITRQARQAIEGGQVGQLGQLMNENHELLQRLAVSSVELDFLCDAALQAGASGAKMSGGGRGGNMIALVTDSLAENVIKALYSAGATRVIKTRIRPE